MIAHYLGIQTDNAYLRGLCEGGKAGISIREIVKICKGIGLTAYPLTIDQSNFLNCPLPAIFYWDHRHFVVVYKINAEKKEVYIADPASGKFKMPFDEFSKHWKGQSKTGIVILIATESDQPSPKKYLSENAGLKGLGRFVLQEIRKVKRKFGSILLLSGICLAADLVVPYILQLTIDEGIGSKDIGLIWTFVLAQFCVFIGAFVATHLSNYLITKLSLHIDMKMVGEYLSKLIFLPLSFFDRRSGSDLIQKISDQSRIRSFLLSLPQTLFFTVLNLVVFSVMMLYYSVPIFFIFLFFTCLGMGWNIFFLGRRRTIDASQFSENSNNRNLVYELVNGMQEIKCNSSEDEKFESWEKSQHRLNDLAMRSTKLGIIMSGGSDVFSRVRELIITGLCASMVVNDALTLGGMMTISYITGRLSGPFSTLMSTISSVQDASLSYDRLEEVISHDKTGGSRKDFSDVGIVLENVWFRYPGSGNPYVLKDVSLTIKPGETIALVGESGCGKSTLIKLMLGFYCPAKGLIRIGGVDVNEADGKEWIRNCGVVMQTGFLFSDSILANVTLTSEESNVDYDRFHEALRIAGIGDYVNKLPMKEHTRVGTTGKEVSGGQRQRLMIARALYKNPSLLIMDEATSSLDANTESAIVERLREYDRNRTVIISAHRLSTVRHADRIFYIKDGTITEQGSHDELMEASGEYFSLVNKQV